jgi:hypothetical protein
MDVVAERMRCMVLLSAFVPCKVWERVDLVVVVRCTALEKLSLVELFSELSVVNSLLADHAVETLDRKVLMEKDMLDDRMLLKTMVNICEKEVVLGDMLDVEVLSGYVEEEVIIGEVAVTCKDILGLVRQSPHRNLAHLSVEDKNIAVLRCIVLKYSVQVGVDNVLLDGNPQVDSVLGDTALLYG